MIALESCTYRERRGAMWEDVEGFAVPPFAMRYHEVFNGWVITHMPSGFAMYHSWRGVTRSAAMTLIAWLHDEGIGEKIAPDGTLLESTWVLVWNALIDSTMEAEVATGRATERR